MDLVVLREDVAAGRDDGGAVAGLFAWTLDGAMAVNGTLGAAGEA